MKKKFLAVLAGTSLAVASLVSCKKDKIEDAPKENLTPEIVEKNLEKEENQKEQKRYTLKNEVGSFKYDTSIDNNYYIMGKGSSIIELKNKSGHIGYYSLTLQKFIIQPQYQIEFLQTDKIWKFNPKEFGGSSENYSTIADELIEVKYENITHVYDLFGNELYNGDGNIKEVTGTIVDKKGYVTLKISTPNNNKFDEVIYKYETGGIKKVSFIPDSVKEVEEIEFEDTVNTRFDDKFVSDDKIDLSGCGMEGYYLENSFESYTVFDSNNTKVSSFSIPSDAQWFLVGQSIIYQESIELPESANDYSYSDSGVKYSLETYKIDLSTGEKKKIFLNYRFLTAKPYKDSEGKYTYGLVRASQINDKKALRSADYYFIDENGNINNELSGKYPETYIKTNNGFFNTTTGIIYDSTLNELSYIGDISPKYDTKTGLFIGYIYKDGNKKYGAIGPDGKIKIPFEFDNIKPLEVSSDLIEAKDGCVIVSKMDKDNVIHYYRYNYKTGNKEHLGTNVKQLASNYKIEDLYYKESINSEGRQVYEILSQSGTVETFVQQHKDSNFSVDFDISNYLIDNAKYARFTIYESWTDDAGNSRESKKYVTYEIEALKTEVPTNGKEINEQEKLGYEIDDALALTVGENNLHLVGDATYFKFTAPKDGLYNFDLINSNVKFILYHEKYGDLNLDENLSKDYSYATSGLSYYNDNIKTTVSRKTVNLIKGDTYYVKFYSENDFSKKYVKFAVNETQIGQDNFVPLEIEYGKDIDIKFNEEGCYYIKLPSLKCDSVKDIKYQITLNDSSCDIYSYNIGDSSSIKQLYKDSYNISILSSSGCNLMIMGKKNNSTNKLKVTIVEEEGSDIFKPYELTDGIRETVPASSIAVFKYSNTTDNDLVISTKSLTDNFDIDSVIIGGLNKDDEYDYSGKIRFENKAFKLAPHSDIYYIVRNENNYAKTIRLTYNTKEVIDATLDTITTDISTEDSFYKFTVAEDGLRFIDKIFDNNLLYTEVTDEFSDSKTYYVYDDETKEYTLVDIEEFAEGVTYYEVCNENDLQIKYYKVNDNGSHYLKTNSIYNNEFYSEAGTYYVEFIKSYYSDYKNDHADKNVGLNITKAATPVNGTKTVFEVNPTSLEDSNLIAHTFTVPNYGYYSFNVKAYDNTIFNSINSITKFNPNEQYYVKKIDENGDVSYVKQNITAFNKNTNYYVRQEYNKGNYSVTYLINGDEYESFSGNLEKGTKIDVIVKDSSNYNTFSYDVNVELVEESKLFSFNNNEITVSKDVSKNYLEKTINETGYYNLLEVLNTTSVSYDNKVLIECYQLNENGDKEILTSDTLSKSGSNTKSSIIKFLEKGTKIRFMIQYESSNGRDDYVKISLNKIDDTPKSSYNTSSNNFIVYKNKTEAKTVCFYSTEKFKIIKVDNNKDLEAIYNSKDKTYYAYCYVEKDELLTIDVTRNQQLNEHYLYVNEIENTSKIEINNENVTRIYTPSSYSGSYSVNLEFSSIDENKKIEISLYKKTITSKGIGYVDMILSDSNYTVSVDLENLVKVNGVYVGSVDISGYILSNGTDYVVDVKLVDKDPYTTTSKTVKGNISFSPKYYD